ncbi:MAG: response regulator [Lentisphaeraceae bacterium]|nr:response regulator [Lentisphaeraceae bacterium]
MNYLMFDDSDTDCRLMAYALEESGKKAEFKQVNSFKEACEYFNNNSPSEPTLICIDLNFPDGDGFQILENVRKQTAGSANLVPIVLSTSSAAKDITKAREKGAFSYVVKPAEFVDWVEFVNNTDKYWSGVNRFPETI